MEEDFYNGIKTISPMTSKVTGQASQNEEKWCVKRTL